MAIHSAEERVVDEFYDPVLIAGSEDSSAKQE